MNKLSLDEIGFIKKRIEQFIDLPASPKWQDHHESRDLTSSKVKQQNKYKDSSAKNNKKVQIKETSPKKTKSGKNDTKNGNQDWVKQKQKQIQNFINQQNRNKVSVLNRFLHSEKIHLKKREEVELDRYKNSRSRQDISQDEGSRNISFDHQFSDLNRAYKKVDSVMALKKVREIAENDVENDVENENDKDKNNDNFSRILKHIESEVSILEKKEQRPKPIEVNFNNVDTLVKPSTIKGKNFIRDQNEMDTPKLSNMNPYKQKPHPNPNANKNSVNQGILNRSNSEISLEKRKAQKNVKYQYPNKGLSPLKHKATQKPLSKDHSHKSFQHYFDEENVSSIVDYSSKNGNIKEKRYRKNNQLNDSGSKNFLSLSRKRFPASVYQKSFKENPYAVSSEQKFFINKYKTKELSPQERRGLKQKYELLDKRLGKILSDVKKEKEAMTPCFTSGDQLTQGMEKERRVMVPEEILAYQKLSPLRKFLAINKEFREQNSMEL